MLRLPSSIARTALNWASTLPSSVRASSSWGRAVRVSSRAFGAWDGAGQITLGGRGNVATWSHGTVDDVPQPPAANDFVLAFAVTFAQRYAGVRQPDVEVHMRHDAPTDAAGSSRVPTPT